ncbi:MAG: hypothetical protein IH571_02920 [Acholeplasmataceae bacterium]|nr:hypothetical protein [Acholeplasmataceae bacterium]
MYLEITIGIVITATILFFIYDFQLKKKKKAKEAHMIDIINQYGKIEHRGHKIYFTTPKQTYQVLFYYIPVNGDLTINSKIVWEIRSSSKNILVDQRHFLSGEMTKLVIVYPTSVVIKRYINENEMVFVKATDRFHNMHVIRHFELDGVLKEGVF